MARRMTTSKKTSSGMKSYRVTREQRDRLAKDAERARSGFDFTAKPRKRRKS